MKLLTMNIYINAWLDCSHPYISIHNKYDDDLLAYFNTEKVNKLITNGEICVEDLQTTDTEIQTEIIAELLAIKSRETIKKQIKDISINLDKREARTMTNNQALAHEKKRANIPNIFPSPVLRTV